MRILIDGLPITGSSLAIVVEHLLHGWEQLADEDELHIVLGPDAELDVPDSVTVHSVDFGRRAALSRVRHQNVTLPRIARGIGADAVLGVLPTTTFAPLPCPRVVIAYDLRHELRPHQFSRMSRAQRAVSYGLGWRQADGIACISDRTRQDLLASRPWLSDRPVEVSHLGADHVDSWARDPEAEPYAIAFGQYGNKNVDLVVDAWKLLDDRGPVLPLVLVGLGEQAREQTRARITDLGLDRVVTVLSWLPIEEFQRRFASASLVAFPSDFEGFGLPAVEAMRLGIPLVITREKTLLEVTDGHATVMDGEDAPALAEAVRRASGVSADDLAAARKHAEQFTWARTAADVRDVIARTVRQPM